MNPASRMPRWRVRRDPFTAYWLAYALTPPHQYGTAARLFPDWSEAIRYADGRARPDLAPSPTAVQDWDSAQTPNKGHQAASGHSQAAMDAPSTPRPAEGQLPRCGCLACSQPAGHLGPHVSKRCGSEHPTNASVIPCQLESGHPYQHYSTSGCYGGAMKWDQAATPLTVGQLGAQHIGKPLQVDTDEPFFRATIQAVEHTSQATAVEHGYGTSRWPHDTPCTVDDGDDWRERCAR